jgi:hypothetical protein
MNVKPYRSFNEHNYLHNIKWIDTIQALSTTGFRRQSRAGGGILIRCFGDVWHCRAD